MKKKKKKARKLPLILWRSPWLWAASSTTPPCSLTFPTASPEQTPSHLPCSPNHAPHSPSEMGCSPSLKTGCWIPTKHHPDQKGIVPSIRAQLESPSPAAPGHVPPRLLLSAQPTLPSPSLATSPSRPGSSGLPSAGQQPLGAACTCKANSMGRACTKTRGLTLLSALCRWDYCKQEFPVSGL